MIRGTLFRGAAWVKMLGCAITPIIFTPVAYAFDVNDCIINGMRGVSSDAAARQVRYACDQKNIEFRKKRQEKIEKEFGREISEDSIEPAKFINPEPGGFYSMVYKNKTPNTTVSFIRISVMPAPKGPETACDTTKRSLHAYKTSVKPGASVKLLYPMTVNSSCVDLDLVLGRPTSWTDVSISSSLKPLDKDPVLLTD